MPQQRLPNVEERVKASIKGNDTVVEAVAEQLAGEAGEVQ